MSYASQASAVGAAADSEVADLTARNQALTSQVSTLTDQLAAASKPPTQTKLFVGMNASDNTATFNAENKRFGGLMRARRVFPQPPTDGHYVAGKSGFDTPAGIEVIPSHKIDTLPAAQRAAACKSLAADLKARGVKLEVIHHEPENDVDGATFSANFKATADGLRNAYPELKVAYAALAYGWRPGGAVSDPSAWKGAFEAADVLGIDDYTPTPVKGPWNVPLKTKADFQPWLKYASTFGKPMWLFEYGRMADPANAGVRPDLLLTDEAYLLSLGFQGWLYWQNTGAAGDWRMTDQGSVDAWKGIAGRGASTLAA